MAVVFGPAQLGKTFTLESIEGDQTFGCPLVIGVDESVLRPFALCRAVEDMEEADQSVRRTRWCRLEMAIGGRSHG